MNDLDNLKKQWRSFTPPDPSGSYIPHDSRVISVSKDFDRILRYYLINGIISFILIPLGFCLILIGVSLWVSILYSTFGGIMTCINFYYYFRIKDCNILLMPVKESVDFSLRIVKWGKKNLITGIILGLFVVIPLFWELYIKNPDDIGLLLSGIFGGVIGGVIGTIKYISNQAIRKRMYKNLCDISRQMNQYVEEDVE